MESMDKNNTFFTVNIMALYILFEWFVLEFELGLTLRQKKVAW